MRHVNEKETLERLDFANEAAEFFAKNRDKYTYTGGPVEPGCYFAVRWGTDLDCVLVIQLDALFTPEIYGQLINKFNIHHHDIRPPTVFKPGLKPGEEWLP